MAGNNRQAHFQREYAKYHFAEFSFSECSEYLDIYERNVDSIRGSGHAFQTAISKSFVITYARPFTNNQKLGMLSDKWTKTIGERLQSLHSQIVSTGRNALVAHMDVYELNATIYLKGGEDDSFIFEWPIPVMNENSIPRLRELLSAAAEFCCQKKAGLRNFITTDRIELEP